MRCLASFLLAVAIIASSSALANAQRGGHGGAIGVHAGGGMHLGGGFRGPSFAPISKAQRGFVPPAARVFSAPVSASGRAPNFNRQFTQSMESRWRGDGGRRPYPGDHNYHQPRIGIFAYNTYLVPNIVGFPFGFGPPFFDDFYDDDDFDQSAMPPSEVYPENDGEPVPPDADESVAAEGAPAADTHRPVYQPGGEEQIDPQPATTLIFNDGRPTEQVHNYVLTSTMLYGFDNGARQEIPLSEINVPATIQVNRSAGVEFSLPSNL
jgi:hypothetical protein